MRNKRLLSEVEVRLLSHSLRDVAIVEVLKLKQDLPIISLKPLFLGVLRVLCGSLFHNLYKNKSYRIRLFLLPHAITITPSLHNPAYNFLAKPRCIVGKCLQSGLIDIPGLLRIK